MRAIQLSAVLAVLALMVFTTACGSRKRYVINKVINSSSTRFMGEVELEPGSGLAEIEVTDHEGAWPEVKLVHKGPPMDVSEVVLYFENGDSFELDDSRVLDKEEPDWDIDTEDYDSSVIRVLFRYSFSSPDDESTIVKLYAVVG